MKNWTINPIIREEIGDGYAVEVERASRARGGALTLHASMWNGVCKLQRSFVPSNRDDLHMFIGDVLAIASSLDAGDIRDAVAKLGQDASSLEPHKGDAGDGGDAISDDNDAPAETQAALLTRLAIDEGCLLFHDVEGTPYVTVSGADAEARTYKLASKEARLWLMRLYHSAKGQVPRAQAIQDALGVLHGRALFDGPVQEVHVRLAGHNGNVYLDLCDERCQVIEITPAGWRVIPSADAPVTFRRAKGMLPLPVPINGGCVDALRPFLNVPDAPDNTQWCLKLAWLVGAFNPRGPYPVLALNGEQGSAKSTTARVLRALIDPHAVPLRSEPREVRDLMIAATNSLVPAFDNLSRIQEWLSDALCRIATGGGYGVREHYANDEETLFNVMRPVLLTGIGQVVTKPDLLDRLVICEQPSIPDEKRQLEETFWAEFERERPAILGALLGAVATALRRKADVRLSHKPRMADFAVWMTAAAPALGWEPDTFINAYNNNRQSANDVALDASPVGVAVVALMESRDEWTGTATDLLKTLTTMVGETTSTSRDWPKKGHVLSNDLKMLAPSLRATGVVLTWERTKKTRMIRIVRGKEGERSVTSVTTGEPASPAASPGAPQASPFGVERHPSRAYGDAGDAGDAPLPGYSASPLFAPCPGECGTQTEYGRLCDECGECLDELTEVR